MHSLHQRTLCAIFCNIVNCVPEKFHSYQKQKIRANAIDEIIYIHRRWAATHCNECHMQIKRKEKNSGWMPYSCLLGHQIPLRKCAAFYLFASYGKWIGYPARMHEQFMYVECHKPYTHTIQHSAFTDTHNRPAHILGLIHKHIEIQRHTAYITLLVGI